MREGERGWIWGSLVLVEEGQDKILAGIIPPGITCRFGRTKGILMPCPARGDGTFPGNGTDPAPVRLMEAISHMQPLVSQLQQLLSDMGAKGHCPWHGAPQLVLQMLSQAKEGISGLKSHLDPNPAKGAEGPALVLWGGGQGATDSLY